MDKLKHIIISCISTFILSFFIDKFLSASLIWLLMLIGKEVIYDKLLSKGQFDYLDIVANFIGCFLGVVLTMLRG